MKEYLLYQIELFEKLASNNFCFFVDLDETLISYTKNKPEKEVIYAQMKDGGYIVKRNGVNEFLTLLNKIGRVYLCSHAKKDYVDEAAKLFGFEKYFDGIFSWSNIWHDDTISPACGDFILFDDLPEHSSKSQKKLKWIKARYEGLKYIHYVQVPAFNGERDNFLIDATKDIEKKLSIN